MRHLALICSLLLLVGCTSEVQRLHDLNPPANDFPSALASEYQAYADSEAEQGRSWTAGHYADKGLKALKGEAVEPELPDTSLSAQSQQELADARAQLMKLLTDDVKHAAPQQAARAQLLFDCWQHELAKKLDQEIAPCADEFHSTMQQLQEASDILVYGKIVRRTVAFAAKSTTLDAESLAIIKNIANELVNLPRYRVQLDAYIGVKSSQRKLTEVRLVAVRHALVKAGVNERRIHIRKARSAKIVVLSKDRLPMDTKKITITIKTQSQAKDGQK